MGRKNEPLANSKKNEFKTEINEELGSNIEETETGNKKRITEKGEID